MHERECYVSKNQSVGRERIKELLRIAPLNFVVIECGKPAKRISAEDCFDFWNAEVKPHLVEPAAAQSGFQLEDFPGQYCYVASEALEEKTITLEMYH